MVNYLNIEGDGGLVGLECTACGARFVDVARMACSSCGGRELRHVSFARTGRVRTFTIVHRGAPGVPVPFVSTVVDLDQGGPSVRANLRGVAPVPESVPRDLRVELELFDVATDDTGAVAVGFGFRPTHDNEERAEERTS
jgi:uncharacterized OB-fold protein